MFLSLGTFCKHFFSVSLDLNAGGKVLLSNRFKPIPLSVWPIVLERANQRKGYFESTNVLYYLLRNGPAMGKRQEWATKPESSFCSPPQTTAVDVEDVIGDFNSAVEGSPIVRFQPSCAFVIPTASRKRKMSMP